MRTTTKPQFKSADQDDLRAIKAIKKGDAQAFTRIVKKYEPFLYQKIYLAVHSKEDAQDILQDIFEKIYLNASAYKQSFTPNAWITRVAHNYLIDWIRKRNVNPMHNNTIFLDQEPIEDDSTTRFELPDSTAVLNCDELDYEAKHKELYSKIDDLMKNHLDSRDQKILQLYFIKGVRQEKIAKTLKMGHVNLRVRIRRILVKLKELSLPGDYEFMIDKIK